MNELLTAILVGAGVPVIVLLGPYLPYLFHREPSIQDVLKAAEHRFENAIRVAGRDGGPHEFRPRA